MAGRGYCQDELIRVPPGSKLKLQRLFNSESFPALLSIHNIENQIIKPLGTKLEITLFNNIAMQPKNMRIIVIIVAWLVALSMVYLFFLKL
jgi:hypothetical protein